MEEKISSESSNPSAAAEPIADKVTDKSTQVRLSAKPRNKTRARIVQIVSVLVLVLLLALLWRFLGDRSTPKAADRGNLVPVETAVVTQQDVPLQIKAIGNGEALSTIAIRSQVDGPFIQVASLPEQAIMQRYVL